MGTLVFQATLGGAVNLIGPNISTTLNLTLPSADGTNGQALTTNGTGTLAFATVGASAATPTALGTVYGKQTTSGASPYLTAIGYNAGLATTGVGCTAVGVGALTTNSTGANHTAIGYRALLNSTVNDNSTAVGFESMLTTTTGNECTAVGYRSLYSQNSGYFNTAIGVQAAYNLTSGTLNTAVGHKSLFTNSIGESNTALGFNALYGNTTASNNTAVGYQAGYTNSTGSENTAIGTSALRLTTTGAGNVANGYEALRANTTGSNSVAIGNTALRANTTASGNIGIGYQAGYTNSTGFNNIYIGYQAGYFATGNGNSFFGTGAGGAITTGAKNTIIGQYDGNGGGLDIRTSSNYIVLSDGDGVPRAYQASTGGWFQYNNAATWSITSDARIKKNVVSLESGLSVIQALRPVEFDFIENEKHDIGFIAQEYQTVLPTQVAEGNNGMLSLNQNLVPYLVKAIQELKAEFDAYKLTHP